ncbi:MAG: hypothetical protein ACLQVK_10745 [Acidimicrobiales bacterium]|jgi:hypothetical protein
MSSSEPVPSSAHWWEGMSRRAFLLRSTVATAAVGAAAAVPGLGGLLTAGASDVPAVEPEATEVGEDAGVLAEPILAHVRDLGTGEITLFQGEQEFVVRNPALARQLFSVLHR